jgi:hypothetical protein
MTAGIDIHFTLYTCCFDCLPCPELPDKPLKTCNIENRLTGKDVGVEVRVVPRINGGSLGLDLESQLDERGGLPPELAWLKRLLDVVGAGKVIDDKYREEISKVAAEVAAMSGNLFSETLIAEGMNAFSPSLDGARFVMSQDGRVQMVLEASGKVPGAAVCAVHKQARTYNKISSGR